MDKNGYIDSIVQWDTEQCAICGIGGRLARHEIFHGPYREKSKNLGLWVAVCPPCHSYLHDHPQSIEAQDLRENAQQNAMTKYGWSKADFIREFGKNYL